MKKTTVLILSCLICLLGADFSANAGTYTPIIRVNESVVTQFEMDQRIRMLKAFGSKGDLRAQATEQLVDDRLRLQAAKQIGITVTELEIFDGMDEFAARGNFTAEQLLTYLKQRGVYRESFEDFVKAGILWRNVVRARFASKVNVTDAEVDATLDVQSINFPKSFQIAEIILPYEERGSGPTRALAERLIDTINNETQFSTAARKFSKSATAAQGGSMGWVPAGNLPIQVASQVSALKVGEMTGPITLGKAIALYQLRGIREAKTATQQVVSVSYMQVAMPLGTAGKEAQVKLASRLINAGDNCLDLEANAQKFKINASSISKQSVSAGQVSPRIGAELSRLDPNEATYYVADNGNVNVLMLCNRAKDLPEGAREQIRNALFGQRIGSFGQGYLQELRGDASIIYK